ncbi:hypothetical protein Asp14428_45280 [Actinoplanes sp. NBRC 14428]|nr:hypothetical protein Asp14428_45280 [Actinoplanes sp. NBRC 14428]
MAAVPVGLPALALIAMTLVIRGCLPCVLGRAERPYAPVLRMGWFEQGRGCAAVEGRRAAR